MTRKLAFALLPVGSRSCVRFTSSRLAQTLFGTLRGRSNASAYFLINKRASYAPKFCVAGFSSTSKARRFEQLNNIDNSTLINHSKSKDMYTQLSEIPTPAGAQFLTKHDQPGPTVVQLAYSVRDHERNTKRAMFKSIIFSLSDLSTTEEQFRSTLVQTRLEEDAEIALQTISPSKQKKAILKNVKKGSNTSRFVEVWSNTRLEATLDVTDLHGDFYNDEFVSGLSFAPSELALIYVAETKIATADPSDKWAKYRYTPDFGEGLTGKRSPSIYLFRWSSGTSSASSQKPTLHCITTPEYEKVRFGQAIFDPQGQNSSESQVIYATGYETTQNGRMLGIKYCPNRPAGIWRLRIQTSEPSLPEGNQSRETKSADPLEIHATSIQKLTPPHVSCRSPRIITVSDRSTLVWLACATGGAHAATNSLHTLDITSTGPEATLGEALLVASDTPLLGFAKTDVQDKSNSRFPGLYPAQNLASTSSVNLITGNGKSSPFVITHSCWGSRTTVLVISLRDGSVRDLTPLSSSEPPYSWTVLSTNSRDEIIVARSTPAIPFEILLGKVGVLQGGREENVGVDDVVVNWYTLDRPDLAEDVSAALSTITTKILPIEGREPVETVLIQSSKSKQPPCITAPHGGPHGTATTAFVPTLTALVLEGYTISQPNYTGSLGFGEAFVQGLIGRCGELDVDEVNDTAQYLVKKGISQEGPGQQFIYGGSHGGFLGAHLISKFPRFFSGAILRNPVISVGEVSTTDIPDWYFSEFGLGYPFASSPRPFDPEQKFSGVNPQITPESYSKLYASSPIAHVDKIEAPVLLLLGKEDRRVAPSHGIGLYHALKARSTANGKSRVELLIFESDSHPLESVEAGKVGFEASRDWLTEQREKK